ncbi:zinc ribbon domain-containing protein [Micromonospora sp. NBRC 101691]|uniref:zinc ribbon domain-containing protein n=1 Tax=Micromonospora sp. NBRC 101691 TaxID=3032198 RepID=UPI0024A3D2B4|nr:zinc ribbon domain-containing protein [Micromonospora sp. NBRC 101691]GLY21777.1 hypothetical protein Misp04_15090 [Micromonospora sp. NBRC 101691]
MPTTPLGFDVHLDHDRHLSPADRELHAILTVAVRAGAGRPADGPDRPRPAGVVDGAESTPRPPTGTTADAVDPSPVRIRIRTVAPNRVLFCRQVHPTVRDLVGVPVDDRTVDHPTGPWGEERREYHLCLAVDGTDRPRDEDLLVARVDLVVDGVARTPPVAVLVHWTDDLTLSSRVDPRVAYHSGVAEPGGPTSDDVERYDSDDPSAVDGLLGRAVRLAAVAGDTRRLEELGLLVDVAEPPPTPTVTDGDVRSCRCGRESSPGARYCERCGTELDAPGAVST